MGVIFDGRFYWMTQLGNNNILRWDQSNKIVKEIHISGESCEQPYGRLFIKDDYIVILPCWSQKLMLINKESLFYGILFENVDSIVYKKMDSWCNLDDYCQALVYMIECKNLKNRKLFNETGRYFYR